MNAKDATRSIFTLGRFQILAQAFKKLDKKAEPISGDYALRVTHMWGKPLENPVILEDQLRTLQFYANHVMCNEAFEPPPFVTATNQNFKKAFWKLIDQEKTDKNPTTEDPDENQKN
ncbi:MAG: hypothetical protein WCJ40_16605 [Planctomycetota bacterium]